MNQNILTNSKQLNSNVASQTFNYHKECWNGGNHMGVTTSFVRNRGWIKDQQNHKYYKKEAKRARDWTNSSAKNILVVDKLLLSGQRYRKLSKNN